MMKAANARVTRDRLVLQLIRAEAEAGLESCWTRSRWSPVLQSGYAHWRENLRDAYFSVEDAKLRGQLIALAAELDLRERMDAENQRQFELHLLAIARSRGVFVGFSRSLVIGGLLLLSCASFAGLTGLFAAAVPAGLVSLGCLRDQIRRDEFTLAKARGATSIAERRCHENLHRAAPFSAHEIQTAMRDSDLKGWSKLGGTSSESRKGARDWIRPLDFRMPTADLQAVAA